MKTARFYQDDLAFIHHTGFGNFARSVAPELLNILRMHGINDGILVDLGCGSGLWATVAQKHGFSVIGVDCSPSMIRLAKKIAPNSTLHCSSFYDFQIPPCAVVTIIGEGSTTHQTTATQAPDPASYSDLSPMFFVPEAS